MNKPVMKTLRKQNQKTLLAIDGGGIRGLIALQFLKQIEEIARERSNNPKLVLSQCYDYIGGTSTGGIIASGLSLGMSVSEIESHYILSAKSMFKRNRIPTRWFNAFYHADEMAKVLQRIFGKDTELGAVNANTLLMLVMHNADTISTWPVSSNPKAKYNDTYDEKCNLKIKLWQLVRASAAAPVYFEPQIIKIGNELFRFYDGGITPYNNPAFKLFQMATLPEYNLNWDTGEDKIHLTSIGTGILEKPPEHFNVVASVKNALRAIAATSTAEQDLICRSFAKVVAGDEIDSEVKDRKNSLPVGGVPLFSYARYNVKIDRESLTKRGFYLPKNITFDLDDLSSIPTCIEVGKVAAQQCVFTSHFDGFW